MEINQADQLRVAMHALRQPLNTLRLTLGNLTHRISADGAQLDPAHIQAKLNIMDSQIQRLADLIDSMEVTSNDNSR